MYPIIDTKRLSHNTDERLIAAVFRREPLWNPTSELHKNSVVLKRLWNDIAFELKKDVTTIKTRWKNLRAYFIKVHRKSDKPKGGDGHDQLSTITWQFYDQLAFLKCCTPGLERDSTRAENDDSNSTLDDTADDNVDDNDKANSDSDSNSGISQASKRKRLRNSTNTSQTFDSERSKTETLEGDGVPERNDDLQFFESLLPYVQNIPLMRKLKLRCKIQEMILKELEAVENDIPQQQTRFTEVYVDNVQSSSEPNFVSVKKEPVDEASEEHNSDP